jgi:hypothetical protein
MTDASYMVHSTFLINYHMWHSIQRCTVPQNSFWLVQDLGVGWVILGHSERRALIPESNELVAEKAGELCHLLSQSIFALLSDGCQAVLSYAITCFPSW